MSIKVHLKPSNYDNEGNILPMGYKRLKDGTIINTEEKGDLISRSALKNAFADMREGYPIFSDTEMVSTKDIAKIIDNAPAVKERPQGEWRVYGRQGGIPITDCCSNCKYEMMWYKNKYKFCPNCGASMKGGAEE